MPKKFIDCSNLDFACMAINRHFDLVVSFSCLHWVKNHLPVLQGIKQVLKRNGRCFLHLGGRGNAAAMVDTLNSKMQEDKWKHYFDDFIFLFGFYGVEEYLPWLEEVGLVTKRIELIPKDMAHKEKMGLKAGSEQRGTLILTEYLKICAIFLLMRLPTFTLIIILPMKMAMYT